MADNKKKYEYVLPEGTVLRSPEGEYTIKRILGQGGFGITYQAKGRRTGDNVFHKYAIKEFFVKGQCWRNEGDNTMQYSPAAKVEIKECLKDFKDEAIRLNKICRGNRYIVNVNEVFEANGTVYYVMEYLEGGSLMEKVRENGGALSEGVALSYIRPIAEAVEYIHSKYNLLHCDIKPDNIMLRLDEEGLPTEPVLIDFGISVHFSNKGEVTTTHNVPKGTPGYSPLEQSRGLDTILQTRRKRSEEEHSDLSIVPYEMDVYALGATLYYLLTGANPAPAEIGLEKRIEKKISECNISDRTRSVILNAMRQPYMERTKTAAEFLKGFEDRYYLPLWFVLKSPNETYQVISGLKAETENFLCYDAIIYTGEQQNENGNATLAHRYTLFEFFVKGVHQRQKDESVTIAYTISDKPLESFFLSAIQKKVGFTEVGQCERIETGLVTREIFQSNGTVYAIVKKGWKQGNPVLQVLRKLGTGLVGVSTALGAILGRNIKTVGKIIALIGIIVLLSIGGQYGYNAYKDYSRIQEIQDSVSSVKRKLIEDSVRRKLIEDIRHIKEKTTTREDTGDSPVNNVVDSKPIATTSTAPVKPFTVSLRLVNSQANRDNRCYVKATVKNPNSEAIITSVTMKGSYLLTPFNQKVTIPANGSKEFTTYFTVTKATTGQKVTASTTAGGSATLNNIQLIPRTESDADIFAKAKNTSDWRTIESLGNKGYSPAYITLAQHYYNMGNASQCEKWAKKAKSAGVNIEQANRLLEELK